jgi:hypothetical protein
MSENASRGIYVRSGGSHLSISSISTRIS